MKHRKLLTFHKPKNTPKKTKVVQEPSIPQRPETTLARQCQKGCKGHRFKYTVISDKKHPSLFHVCVAYWSGEVTVNGLGRMSCNSLVATF